MDLDLLLLNFTEVSQAQVDGLAAAAGQGRLAEVGCFPKDPKYRHYSRKYFPNDPKYRHYSRK